MADQPETRIVTRDRTDGTTEISVYIPGTGREHRTGLKVPRGQADAHCQKIAETLKRAGNRVNHKNL